MENILIVGATSAIAQAIARLLAADAKNIMLWGRSGERLDAVAQDLRVRGARRVEIRAFEIVEHEKHESALDEAIAAFGGLDLVLIAHGSLTDQKAAEKDFHLALQELQVNCISTLSLLSAVGNYFETRKGGCIAVLSSVAGERGRQSNYIYGTAKAAVSTFLQGLRHRLYASGVQVLTIKPGFVDTPMTAAIPKNFLFATPEQVAADVVSAIRTGRAVVYTPWFWRYIMLLIRTVPERLFVRTKL